MIGVYCRVAHEPENGTYGDCVRACVASILEMQPEDVPHFLHDNCDGVLMNARLVEFLDNLGFAPYYSGFETSLNELFHFMATLNPHVHYMLFGKTESGNDHVIVCKGDKVAHDPAWIRSPMNEPGDDGFWKVMVIARK